MLNQIPYGPSACQSPHLSREIQILINTNTICMQHIKEKKKICSKYLHKLYKQTVQCAETFA